MSEAQAQRPHRRRLGDELRRLRLFAGQTQRELAASLGTNQTAIDRIEKGGPAGKPPGWPRVQAWARACATANPDMAELRALVEAALDEHTLYRHLMSEGLAAGQEDIRSEEAIARTLRMFNPWGIPGLLQTGQYARRVLALSDYQRKGGIEEAVQARLRRQEILEGQTHHLEFVLTEEGLLRRVVPAAALAVQLDELVAAVSRPAVSLAVIPVGVTAYALPMFGFVIHDDLADGGDPWVAVETYHKRVITAKPDEVEIYRAQYSLLRRSAVSGDEAVEFVREVARSLS
jgi:transcriptional regulator with XRE-family HTH domain